MALHWLTTGRAATEAWLNAHYDKTGWESTVDIRATFLPKAALPEAALASQKKRAA